MKPGCEGSRSLPPGSPLRLFFALPVPDPVRAQAARIRSRASDLKASWAPLEGLHLTLAFLGAQPAGLVPTLRAAAREVAAGHRPFTLTTAGPGGFPRLGAARVLWLGCRPEPALEALAADLRAALAARAVPFDPSPFRPHLTLARLKKPGDLSGLARDFPGVAFPVQELILYQSTQTPAGSRYTPLGSTGLGQIEEFQEI